MTTKQYNTEDFANAEFARNPDGGIAARFDDDDAPWISEDENWHSDATMASYGWVPVQEATAQPITLDALRDAWEGAGRTSEYKAGDEVISCYGDDDFSVVRFSADRVVTTSRFRLLHRATKPQRPEGAERLDAMLRALVGDPALLADWLAERWASKQKKESDE